jgi:hypothetical protein
MKSEIRNNFKIQIIKGSKQVDLAVAELIKIFAIIGLEFWSLEDLDLFRVSKFGFLTHILILRLSIHEHDTGRT